MRSPYERTGAERVVFEFAFAIVIMITLSEQKESAPTTAGDEQEVQRFEHNTEGDRVRRREVREALDREQR